MVLTVGEATYPRVLDRVDRLRKSFLQVGNGFASRASKAASKKDALQAHEEGFQALEQLYTKNKGVRGPSVALGEFPTDHPPIQPSPSPLMAR